MNSRVVTSFDVGWIVEIMCKCSALVDGRERVCMGLGLLSSQLTDIDRYCDKNARTYGYLTMALNLWISISMEATIEKLIEVLRILEFNSTADEISEKQTDPPNSDANLDRNYPCVWFDVPEDVHMFTGRVEQMKEMHESIIGQHNGNEKNDMTVLTAVSGMGGVGKTSLTIHYAWKFFKVFYVNVIWINSETKNTITDSFNRLARKLGQSTSSKLIDIVLSVYEYFGKTKTLVIFDNVESYNDVKSYIPIRSPNTLRPYVLLTSRNRDWNLRTYLIDVNVFKTQESVEFFESFLGLTTKEEMELAEKISLELQNLPLAIRQAGAYIKVQRREGKELIIHVLKAYLDLFETNAADLLKFEHWSHTADIYEKTIYTTWTVNMEKLKRQSYMTNEIIGLISYFNSDNIPIKLLLNISDTRVKLLLKIPAHRAWKGWVFGENITDSDVYSAIKLLSDFSLITRHVDLESISIHRLLQKVVRDEVERKYKNTQLDCAIRLIRIPLLLNNYDDYEDICLIHSLSIREYIPENRLQKRKIKSFLKLISSKQENSIDKNINRLNVLFEEGRYVELLELYENIRKLYITQAGSMGYGIDEVFTVKFLNTVLSDIIKYCELNTKYDGIVIRCQVVQDVLLGYIISPGVHYLYSMMTALEKSIEMLYTIVVDDTLSFPKHVETRNKILLMLYHVIGIFCETRTVRISPMVDNIRRRHDMRMVNIRRVLDQSSDITQYT